jgi:hypothetical protein
MKPKICTLPALFIVTVVLSQLVLGESFMNWYSSFESISLPAIAGKNQTSEGSSTAILILNGDAQISADNSSAAQLSSSSNNLVTEYKLTFDGNGSDATGGDPTNYETYDTFLSTPAQINYVLYDDEVEITLHVRASSNSSGAPDAGDYSATQTLTVHWLGP